MKCKIGIWSVFLSCPKIFSVTHFNPYIEKKNCTQILRFWMAGNGWHMSMTQPNHTSVPYFRISFSVQSIRMKQKPILELYRLWWIMAITMEWKFFNFFFQMFCTNWTTTPIMLSNATRQKKSQFFAYTCVINNTDDNQVNDLLTFKPSSSYLQMVKFSRYQYNTWILFTLNFSVTYSIRWHSHSFTTEYSPHKQIY